jgi:SP family myo-inositol transporter-like MFS transporter 13
MMTTGKHEKDRDSSDDVASTNDDSGEINELSVVAEGEERTTWFVWALVTCSTISGLLFGKRWSLDRPSTHSFDMFFLGYDTGVISGALVTIDSDLGVPQLSDGQKVRFYIFHPSSIILGARKGERGIA